MQHCGFISSDRQRYLRPIDMRLSEADPSVCMQTEKSSASHKGPRGREEHTYELRLEAVYLNLLVLPSCTGTCTACRTILPHYLGILIPR